MAEEEAEYNAKEPAILEWKSDAGDYLRSGYTGTSVSSIRRQGIKKNEFKKATKSTRSLLDMNFTSTKTPALTTLEKQILKFQLKLERIEDMLIKIKADVKPVKSKKSKGRIVENF